MGGVAPAAYSVCRESPRGRRPGRIELGRAEPGSRQVYLQFHSERDQVLETVHGPTVPPSTIPPDVCHRQPEDNLGGTKSIVFSLSCCSIPQSKRAKKKASIPSSTCASRVISTRRPQSNKKGPLSLDVSFKFPPFRSQIKTAVRTRLLLDVSRAPNPPERESAGMAENSRDASRQPRKPPSRKK